MSYGKIEVDLRDLEKSVRAAERAGADLRPVWRSLRTPLKRSQRDHITAQKSLAGGKFPGLAASTVQRRLSRGGKSKKFTKKGKLRAGIRRRIGRTLSKKLLTRARVKVTPRSISLFARGAVAHALFGGTRAGKRRRSVIPARQFVYVDDPMARMAFDSVAKHVAESLETGKTKR